MLRLLELAARYSIADDSREHMLGACAIRHDGAIVHARNKSITKIDHDNYLVKIHQHAEARLLPKLDHGATVYVARLIKYTRLLANAKPCVNCQRLLRNYGVIKVYYTISEDEYGVWYPQKNDEA